MTTQKRTTPTRSGDERDFLGEDKQPMGPGGRKEMKRRYSKRDRAATKRQLRYGQEF